MARAYLMDLRKRVVAAVEREGLSCYEAAARFGVAASSAIKWVCRFRDTGVASGQIGGTSRGRCVASFATRCWNGRGATSRCGDW